MATTHYYGIIGDGHTRGKRGNAPSTIDPLFGVNLNYTGASALPQLNEVVRGATSTAIGRVTSTIGATSTASGAVTLEMFGLTAFRAGETLNFDSGTTATCSTFITGSNYPGSNQFALEHYDATLRSSVPDDGVSDTPWWDRNCKVARQLTVATGFTGSFVKGDRVTTSGGAAFTILLSTVAGSTLVLKVIRVTGTLADGQTLTNTTRAGGGTITGLQADPPVGAWVPFNQMPNLAGLGTFFERIPNGNGTDGLEAGVGPEAWLLRKAYEKNVANSAAADRGTRVLSFSSFDYGNATGALGGVTVQTVRCTVGTFPTTWVIGETITSAGGWSAKVAGYNATTKDIYVTNTNGATLGNVTVTGATSGAAALSDGPAYGFAKGSKQWLNLVAEIATATSAAGGTYSGSAVAWDGVFLMIWEAELAPFLPGNCPWPTSATMIEAWVRFIGDLRTQLNNAQLPIALFQMDVRSQATTVSMFGVPFAFLLRQVMETLAAQVSKVTLVRTDGMQGSSTTGLPYPSNIVYLRPDDYLELGLRAWRALEFSAYTIPAGDFSPLPLIFVGGQSQAVGSINPAFMTLDLDPDLYSSASFPGVSSLDDKVFIWNANDNLLTWQNYDVAVNGNTFYGQSGFSGFMVGLAHRMKRRFATGSGSGEVGFIHLPVGGTSCNASAPGGAIGTWDPEAPGWFTAQASMTCTAIAATSLDPQVGRFTATNGTFAAFTVGKQCHVAGSALGLLGAGGNNHPPYGLGICYRKGPNNEWVDIVGAFVTEGATTFTINNGTNALMPLVKDQVRAAFEKCVTQLRRIPKPVLVTFWQGEGDLSDVANYQAALQRVLDEIHTIFSQRHKGETKCATVIMQLTRRTPVNVPDADIETLISAQQGVAAALGNAISVSTDQLPMEVGSPPVWPRTSRLHNGIHHTARGFIMAGYLADAAAGKLAGIPASPDGDAAIDFGADGGAIILTDAPSDADAAPSATLIVEDGTGLATANSYATAAEANTYFDATTNPAAWLAATTTQREQALRVATQWLDAKHGALWVGIRSSSEQALDWPRELAYDRAGNLIDAVVPVRLKQACAEVALRYIQDATLLAPDLAAGTGVRAESLQVGPISISTTFNGEPTPETTFTTVARLLSSAGLTAAGGFAQR